MKEWMLTSSVLILLVLAVRYLFKNKMKAKYTYALWLIVLVRLLCPINFGELSFNLLSLAEEGKVQLEEHLETEATDWETAMQQGDISWYKEDGTLYFSVPDSTETEYRPEWLSKAENSVFGNGEVKEVPFSSEAKPLSPLPEIDWQKVLPILWMAGMVLMAVVICNVNISFSTTLGMLRKELPSFAKKGWGKTDLSVYVADGINSSCLFGVIHPSIYLNKKGMNDREKKYCVEHEYSHYLQGDMIWSLCRTVCLVLHWYNPLVWLAVVLSKKDAELACDERTIARLGEEERYSYGHTLVELAAGQSRAVQVLGMATLMAPDKKEVVDRVKAITTKKETKIITGLLVAILVVGIGCFVFTGEAKGEQENNNVVPTPTVAAEAEPTLEPVKIVHAAANEELSETGVTTQKSMATYRLYSDRDRNSAYIEVEYAPEDTHAIAGVLEAGSEWFYTETKDFQSGWLLYGENSDIDEAIRGLLRVSGEDWDKVREEKKQTVVLSLKEEVNYIKLSFTDHVALPQVAGEGWSIDLNGDGTQENLYISADGVFVNGERKFLFSNKQSFWLLDIDTTDAMYELLNSSGDMYIYDGNEFQCVKGIQEVYFAKGLDNPEDFTRYFGTLNEFTRIDEHTIAFEDCFFMTASFFATAQYVLDENHGLQMIPQVYEVASYDVIEGVHWADYYNTGASGFKLYAEPDLSAAYVEVKKLSDTNVLKSDCVEWVYVETKDGLSGWLYFGNTLGDYYFTVENNNADYVKVPLRLYEEKNDQGAYVEVPFAMSMVEMVNVWTGENDWCRVDLDTGESGWVPFGGWGELAAWYLQKINEQ